MVLAPFPFWMLNTDAGLVILVIAVLASVFCLACAFVLPTNPLFGKFLGMLAAGLCYASYWPGISSDPFAALMATVLVISAGFFLIDIKADHKRDLLRARVFLQEKKAWWSCVMLLVLLVVYTLLERPATTVALFAVVISLFITISLYMQAAISKRSKSHVLLALVALFVMMAAYLLGGFDMIPGLAVVLCAGGIFSLSRENRMGSRMQGWEFLVSHPARILLTSFSLMCIIGTVLLSLPVSSKS